MAVETIFKPLPVRRQELEKNIKREYAKVLVLLQAYACISTNVRLSVSNVMGKKKAVVFSSQSNKTTRENIANVFGTKALSSLIALDLEFEMKASGGASQGFVFEFAIMSMRLINVVVSKSKSWGMFQSQFSVRVGRLQTDRCSSSTRGLVRFLKLQRPSTKCINHIIYLSRHLFLQMSYLIQVCFSMDSHYCSRH